MVEITIKEFGSKMTMAEASKMMDICIKKVSVSKLEHVARHLAKKLSLK